MDWAFLGLTLALVLVGLVNLYSASQTVGGFAGTPPYVKQLYWLGLGLFAFGLALRVDYRQLATWAYPAYGGCLLLLAAVLVVGRTTSGAQRWLTLAGFSLQPAELTKLALILVLALYFSEKKGEINLKRLGLPFLLLILPLVLILKQPDLGTAVVLVLIFFSLLFLAELPFKSWLVILSATVLASPFSWFFLKDYQKARIVAFLNPMADPAGVGYQSLQSKIAVGSGKILGKGFLEGTQTKLRFLPEQQTDFIFSVLAEEWGLIGALALLALYLCWVSRVLTIAVHCRDAFGTLVTYGIASLLFWQVIINIAMAIGLAPVVGVPLPFISYGGSSLFAFLLGAGLILNVQMRRHVN